MAVGVCDQLEVQHFGTMECSCYWVESAVWVVLQQSVLEAAFAGRHMD